MKKRQALKFCRVAWPPSPHLRRVELSAVSSRKITLRAELELESARIAETLPSLTESENAELRELLASEEKTLDADVLAIAKEEAASRNVKRLAIPLSKTASRILSLGIERRLELGHCPDLAILAEQAIRQAYGGAS